MSKANLLANAGSLPLIIPACPNPKGAERVLIEQGAGLAMHKWKLATTLAKAELIAAHAEALGGKLNV